MRLQTSMICLTKTARTAWQLQIRQGEVRSSVPVKRERRKRSDETVRRGVGFAKDGFEVPRVERTVYEKKDRE